MLLASDNRSGITANSAGYVVHLSSEEEVAVDPPMPQKKKCRLICKYYNYLKVLIGFFESSSDPELKKIVVAASEFYASLELIFASLNASLLSMS
jgi:hypothetical protein